MRQLISLVVGSVLLVLGAMFSLVLLAVLAVFGLGFIGWFWWKTRALRQALREQQARQAPVSEDRTTYREGTVFDGEAVVVEEESAIKRRLTSADLRARPDTPPP